MNCRASGDNWNSPRPVEGVGVAFEQAHVRVHAGTWVLGEWLGHERCDHPVFERDLLDHEPEGRDVVRGRQRVGVTRRSISC